MKTSHIKKKEAEVWDKREYTKASEIQKKAYSKCMKIFYKLGYWEEDGKALEKFPTGKDAVVLDIGCGIGETTNAIKGKKVIGIDLSTTQINLARKNRKKNTEFMVADAENLKFEDNYFDYIFATNILHHVPNPVKALKECRRVLKPNGKIITMDPNKTSPIGNLTRFISTKTGWDKEKPVFSRFTLSPNEKQFRKKEYREMFEKAGLKVKIIPHRFERVIFFGTLFFPYIIYFPFYSLICLVIYYAENLVVKIPGLSRLCYFWMAEATK